MKLNVGQFLKKDIISACWNRFLGFLQIFQPAETTFPASGNRVFIFSIECYSFQQVEIDFFLVFFYSERIFVLAETIIQIKVKPYSLSSTIGNHYFYAYIPIYIHIFLPVKAVFRRSENIFFNKSFIPAG